MWGWGFDGSTTGLNGWNGGGIDLSVLTGKAVSMRSLRLMDIGAPAPRYHIAGLRCRLLHRTRSNAHPDHTPQVIGFDPFHEIDRSEQLWQAACYAPAWGLLVVRAHMQLIAIVLIAVGALITPFYVHALVRFRRILLAERPDLADRRGSLSFFYTGMPRLADPNVGAAVVGAAFGAAARELQDPDASKYARRIRLSLLVGMPAYLVALAILVIGAP